jgi:uncharacterized membrane protein
MSQQSRTRTSVRPGHWRNARFLSLTLALAAGSSACDRVSPTEEPVQEAPILVGSVSPSEGTQGQRLEVRIHGSGFASDDSVSWERGGVVDPKIVIEGVVFVSSTELLATISIGPDADSVTYDVAVRPRKRGIGTERPPGTGVELFRVRYQPEALGWIGTGVWAGPFSVAMALNDDGVIVGIGGGSNSTAVFWSHGSITPFGGSPGLATGINNRGWIVGTRGERNDLLWVDPFVYADGQLTILEVLEWPHASWAEAINDAGTVVGRGSRDYWADPTWPLVWFRGQDGRYGPPVELPLPDGETWVIDQHQEGSGALAINERGDIVGVLRYGWSADQVDRPVLWRLGSDGTYQEPIILGGGGGTAYSINNSGWIAGSLRHPAGGTIPAVWSPDDYSTPIPLDQTAGYSIARSINDSGYVVGHVGIRGVLWRVDVTGSVREVTTLLPSPGYTGVEPRSINSDGWVVGFNWGQGVVYEATLWRP